MKDVLDNIKSKVESEYMNSRMDLMGEIPMHWKIIKLKFICRIYNGDSLNEKEKLAFESNDEFQLPYISTKDIDYDLSKIDYENGLKIPKKNNKLKVAPKNSFLLCIEGGSAGKKAGYLKEDVCFVNKLACFSVMQEYYSKYYFYFSKSNFFQTQFSLSMTGLIGGVAISLIKNFEAYLPSFSDQIAIAQFLDYKTALINQAIGNKQKQIELLNERKKLLIHNAVTRGLDPNVKTKDSGVEWIGEIPVGWEVTRVKYLFKQSKIPADKNDGVVTAFRDGEVTLRTNRRTEGFTIAILEQGYQKIKKGQLVLNSMDAFEGAIGVSDSEGKCTPEYVICDPLNDDLLSNYYAFLLREMALAKYIQVICNAVRERAIRIRFSNLSPLFIIVPPINEQKKICSYIETVSEKINIAVSLKEKEIEKLKEYKATLINSAVTGKIKVN